MEVGGVDEFHVYDFCVSADASAKQRNEVVISVLDGDILGRQTLIVFEGSVSAKLQQQAHCFRMPFCGGHHQWGDTDVCLGINVLRPTVK
jgi:hypothetical protein